MLVRWRDYLKAAAAKQDPVFAAWCAGVAQKTPSPLSSPGVPAEPSGLRNNRVVAAAFDGKPPKDAGDLAARYGALLAKFDGAKPWPDVDEEALRLALRGAEAPTN